ncbi:MAG: hypothetical protein JRN62_02525 [Nitrososphaerota archaeon]|jgi:hypothetical protein|nr:hypothetical protein [Nitrososphaerota archaeon]MDG6948877.1 hypothetical protein [Nitrososphaerota archaeon]
MSDQDQRAHFTGRGKAQIAIFLIGLLLIITAAITWSAATMSGITLKLGFACIGVLTMGAALYMDDKPARELNTQL